MNLQHSLAYNYGLDYLNNNKKLTKEQQQEYKYFLVKEIVNHYCCEYIDAKAHMDKEKCMKISKKIDRLSKISIFDKVNYGYYKSFILEIKTFQYHQHFETGINHSEVENSMFGMLEVSRFLHDLQPNDELEIY